MSQSRWQEQGAVRQPLPSAKKGFFKRPWSLILMALALIGAGFLIWWGMLYYLEKHQDPADIPLIEAEEGPYKVRPEDPHTHKIPHKEKTIYEHFSRDGSDAAEKEVKIRSLPAAPVKEGPTLPAEFIQAFSDPGQFESGQSDPAQRVVDSPDGLPDLQEERPPGEDLSPFYQEAGAAKGQEDISPFAERDGFFEGGASFSDRGLTEKSKEPGLQEPEACSEINFIAYPSKISCVEGLCVAGFEAAQEKGDRYGLELCQAASEKTAKDFWTKLKKTAPDLLAARKVIYKKIDHGKKNLEGKRGAGPPAGFLYHVTIPNLPQEKADLLQKELSKRGLYSAQVPY